MKFEKTDFKDLVIVKHNVFEDERGFFKEKFKEDELEKFLNQKLSFCQENSVRSFMNVLRGLHFQKDPYAQSKLISVNIGRILDVCVDIRRESISYGKYFSYILDSRKHESLYIPKGFAHGYLTLSETALIDYKVDNYYKLTHETGISYNDPFLNIDWGISEQNLIISEKDKNQNIYNW